MHDSWKRNVEMGAFISGSGKNNYAIFYGFRDDFLDDFDGLYTNTPGY
jgi:hypothetical protein